MADTAHLMVSEDLDTLRRSLSSEGDLSPALARFLAACGGTLRAHVAGARTPERGTPDAAGEERP